MKKTTRTLNFKGFKEQLGDVEDDSAVCIGDMTGKRLFPVEGIVPISNPETGCTMIVIFPRSGYEMGTEP